MPELEDELMVEMALQMVPVHVGGPLVPKPIHKVVFTGLGDEVMMDVGFFDLRQVFDLVNFVRAKKAEGADIPPASFTLFVTDRFMLTANAAVDLLRTAERIVKHFQKRKLLPEDLTSIQDDQSVMRFDFPR